MVEEYFVTCEVAIALRAAGFDEPCMGVHEYYQTVEGPYSDELHINYSNRPTNPDTYNDTIRKLMLTRPGLFVEKHRNSELQPWFYAAPLYDQVIDWFLTKGLYLHPYKTIRPKKNKATKIWGVNILNNDGEHLWPAVALTRNYSQEMQKYLTDGRRLALNTAILAGLKLLDNVKTIA